MGEHQVLDLDAAIARQDQTIAQRYLQGWDFQYAVPGSSDPVVLQSWEEGQRLGFEIHGSWVRENSNSPWRFEFLLAIRLIARSAWRAISSILP